MREKGTKRESTDCLSGKPEERQRRNERARYPSLSTSCYLLTHAGTSACDTTEDILGKIVKSVKLKQRRGTGVSWLSRLTSWSSLWGDHVLCMFVYDCQVEHHRRTEDNNFIRKRTQGQDCEVCFFVSCNTYKHFVRASGTVKASGTSFSVVSRLVSWVRLDGSLVTDMSLVTGKRAACFSAVMPWVARETLIRFCSSKTRRKASMETAQRKAEEYRKQRTM